MQLWRKQQCSDLRQALIVGVTRFPTEYEAIFRVFTAVNSSSLRVID